MGVSQDGRVHERGTEGEGVHTSKKDREEGVRCDPLAVEVAAAAANESLRESDHNQACAFNPSLYPRTISV